MRGDGATQIVLAREFRDSTVASPRTTRVDVGAMVEKQTEGCVVSAENSNVNRPPSPILTVFRISQVFGNAKPLQ
jgi:hypothetical protein